MIRSTYFFLLAAFLIVVCGAQAHVIQPDVYPDAPDPADFASFSQGSDSIQAFLIETPSIHAWSSRRSFSGNLLLVYGGVKPLVPAFEYDWIGCNGNPINYIDPDGRDVYAVYRPFGEKPLSSMFPLVGHVYLVFDDKNTSSAWQGLMNASSYDDEGLMRRYDEYGVATFSFHPHSMKTGDKTGNLVGPIDTIGTWVDINNRIADVNPFRIGNAKIIKLTDNEFKQIELFENARSSAEINRSSMTSYDYGPYSLFINNCGTWAKRMVQSSGLKWPLRAYDWNRGTALGGVMDWTMLPQTGFYSLHSNYRVIQSLKNSSPTVPSGAPSSLYLGYPFNSQ